MIDLFWVALTVYEIYMMGTIQDSNVIPKQVTSAYRPSDLNHSATEAGCVKMTVKILSTMLAVMAFSERCEKSDSRSRTSMCMPSR